MKRSLLPHACSRPPAGSPRTLWHLMDVGTSTTNAYKLGLTYNDTRTRPVADLGPTMRGACMERHTAKYSEIQPNSIQPARTALTLPHGARRACRGSGAWPGCAQAAVHAAMGAGYRPTPSVTPSSPTGTLSACVSVCLSAPFGAIHQEHHTAYHSCIAPYM